MGEQATVSNNSLGPGEDVGEAGDILGMGGNIVQALDQGTSIFNLGGGFEGGGFMAGSHVDLTAGAPLFKETMGVQRGFNFLGGVTGALSAYQGYQDWTDETKSGADQWAGMGNMFSGAVGAVGGAIGTIAPSATGFLGNLASAGGGMGLGADIGVGATWGGGAGAAGLGTFLASSAAVVGAGTAGYGLGRYGDKNMENLDWLADDKGKNRSISDWGSDLAVGADESVTEAIGGEQGSWQRAIGNKVGGAAGYTTAGITSLLGVPLAIGSTAVGLGNAVAGIPGAALNAASNCFGSAMQTGVDLANWMTP